MQKVQRWSQPFCTCTKARARPCQPSIRCSAVSLTDMMSSTRTRSLCVHAESRGADPDVRAQLLGIADDLRDLVHRRERCRLDLRRAAGDHDLGLRVEAAELADRLPRLGGGFRRHRAGVDDDQVVAPGASSAAFLIASDSLAFRRQPKVTTSTLTRRFLRRWRGRTGLRTRSRPARSSICGRRSRAREYAAARRAASP